MKYKPPTPKDFADAVFGDKPLTGDSYMNCIEQAMETLKEYNYNPTYLSNKQPLTEIRRTNAKFAQGHHAFSSRSENYILCKSCFNNSNKEDDFACCVIAIVSPYKPNDNEKNGDNNELKNALVKVDAVIPHSSECHLPQLQRRNSIMDKENGGSGWIKFPFPTELIIDDAYKTLLDKLSSLPKDGEHFGTFM